MQGATPPPRAPLGATPRPARAPPRARAPQGRAGTPPCRRGSSSPSSGTWRRRAEVGDGANLHGIILSILIALELQSDTTISIAPSPLHPQELTPPPSYPTPPGQPWQTQLLDHHHPQGSQTNKRCLLYLLDWYLSRAPPAAWSRRPLLHYRAWPPLAPLAPGPGPGGS